MDPEPDGWERFERAVDAAVKSGPKHRLAPKAEKPIKEKGRPKTAPSSLQGLARSLGTPRSPAIVHGSPVVTIT